LHDLSHKLASTSVLTGLGYEGSRLFWLPDQAPTSRVAYAGAPQTIDVMRRAVLEDADHFETRQLAEIVCEGLDSKDYTSEYHALYYFLLQRCRYMRDPRRTEFVRAPYVISRQIMAGHRPSLDCDDMAGWLGAAIVAVGGLVEFITCSFQRMFFDGVPQYSHVYTRALEPRTRSWIVLDPVAAEKTPQMLRRIVAAEAWPVTA
jgi:hypothetical protein